ncbi:MAG: hypothetical protein LIP09_12000 [Bacteroidales bacterium]|nr:hypothetical protein [Bacteroidales bacterium]
MAKQKKTTKNLKEIYEQVGQQPKEPTPKAKFVSDLAAVCKVSENTVRGWLSNNYKPDSQLVREQAAKFLNADINTLFNY